MTVMQFSDLLEHELMFTEQLDEALLPHLLSDKAKASIVSM